MKSIFNTVLVCLCCTVYSQTLTKSQLLDKIKGGWAGQTIGVTFGGPVEFRYCGTIIQPYQPIPWYKGYVADQLVHNDGLFDDLYMDLTWVEVLERDGLNATAEAFGDAFAHKSYKLWHANQAARYNILHGIKPPQSGHWIHNPHADCIDFQIEADFAGLMSPGMPQAASEISDRVGHVMNYGDGWYGGVFIANLYSLAFTSNDIPFMISQALGAIPKNTKYYKVISDVMNWYTLYPLDWKRTWFALQNKWSEDIGCPEGVFHPFNIDATINSAYVVIGLLYGHGDFTKTLEITTRCGQDADCNPSSAGGILGTMLGYSKIPAYWMEGLDKAEDINFAYTDISLNKIYELSMKHALENIKANGGTVNENSVFIKSQSVKPVQYEQSFEHMTPTYYIRKNKNLQDTMSISFTGTGIVVKGYVSGKTEHHPYIANVDFLIDGRNIESATLPAEFTTRRYELFWKYQLTKGNHLLQMKLNNPEGDHEVRVTEVLVYGEKGETLNGFYKLESK